MNRYALYTSSSENLLLLKKLVLNYDRVIKILSVGAGECRAGGINMLGSRVINIDIKYNKNLDVICNGEMLSFKSNSFDAVILEAVLEHAKNYENLIKETYRVLKDGAYIYVEVPFLQGEHFENDYRRFTLDGLKLELNQFKEIKSGILMGPFVSFVWITSMLLALIFSLDNKWLFNKIRLFFLYLISPLKYLDIFFLKSSNAKIIASAFYFLGKK